MLPEGRVPPLMLSLIQGYVQAYLCPKPLLECLIRKPTRHQCRGVGR
jgi:hypothetical protein